jgi:hypothetical protein
VCAALQKLFRPPVAGDGQPGVAASVGTVLKDSLARVLRCRNESITPWQKRLEMALRGLGADAVADSALRHLERQAARWGSHKDDMTPLALHHVCVWCVWCVEL